MGLCSKLKGKLTFTLKHFLSYQGTLNAPQQLKALHRGLVVAS